MIVKVLKQKNKILTRLNILILFRNNKGFKL